MNYRLQIHRDGAHWGHFDCSGPDACNAWTPSPRSCLPNRASS